ncbi:MAG: hypothetical protein R3F19_30275 [Verrucomicrobiales bacterium]
MLIFFVSAIDDSGTGDVTIKWFDFLGNEEGFVVYRKLRYPEDSPLVELGRFGPGDGTVTDPAPTPGWYSYQVTAFNVYGTSNRIVEYNSPEIGPQLQLPGPTEVDGVHYFSMRAPAQLARFETRTASWLPAIPLSFTPEAVYANSDGIYVTGNYGVWRIDSRSGVVSRLVSTFDPASRIVFAEGDIVYYYDAVLGRLALFDQRTGESVASPVDISFSDAAYYFPSLKAAVIQPNFGNLQWLQLENDGMPLELVETGATLEREVRSMVLSPDGTLFLASNGTMFSADRNMALVRNLASNCNYDAGFTSTGRPLVICDGRVSYFNENLLEAGRVNLSYTPIGLAAVGDEVLTFTPDLFQAEGIRVDVISLADLQGLPSGRLNVPDGIDPYRIQTFVTDDGQLGMVDSPSGTLFRWDAASRTVAPPAALIGSINSLAWDARNDRLLLGYPDGLVTATSIPKGGGLAETSVASGVNTFVLVPSSLGLFTGSGLYAADGSFISEL